MDTKTDARRANLGVKWRSKTCAFKEAPHRPPQARLSFGHRGATSLLAGIVYDDPEVLEREDVAAAISTKVAGGTWGSVYSFGIEALVTQEQVDLQRDRMVKGGREMAEATRRFYSENEWTNIQGHLRAVSDYLPLDAVIFQRLEKDDTALHVAVRHGSLRIAGELLAILDPLARNAREESVAMLLDELCREFLLHERNHRRREDEEEARERRDLIHCFAEALRSKLEAYEQEILEPLLYKQWRDQTEGFLSEEESAKMDLSRKSDALRSDMSIAVAVSKKTVPLAQRRRRNPSRSLLTARALFSHISPSTQDNHNSVDLLIIDNHSYDNVTASTKASENDESSESPRSLSSLSSGFFDDVDIGQWLVDLDNAALLIQSAWRASSSRIHLVNAINRVLSAQ